MEGRKRRADAFEKRLTEEQFVELRDGLLGQWTYTSALQWLADECGVSSSLAALSGFWEHYCAPVLKERRQMAVLKAEEITRAAESDGVDFGAAGMERLRQLTFEFLLQDGADVDSKAVARLMKIVLADKALGHDARKLAILEKKAAALEEAEKIVTDATTTDSEKAVKVRELFGITG